MSDNLDDFLRQAAERRAKRQQQKSGGNSQSNSGSSNAPTGNSGPIQRNTSTPQTPASRPLPSQKPASQSPSPQSSSRTRQSVPSPNARTNQGPVAADVVSGSRPPVGNLRTTLEQRHVESNLEYADERLEAHLQEAFDSDLRKSGKSNLRPSSAPAPTAASITPTQRSLTSGDLKDQLRNPQTLRLAILAQEILKRPYQ